MWEEQNQGRILATLEAHPTRHSDIGPSAYFAKLGKKKVNEEKEIEKHRK